ncbi:MAG: bifunctional response regulator/alkaline phosphatase family protein [Chitinophagales bacterium]|nr:bifunctional response regulator/alkaline phosphatase family protein [Chitinophagales bacterium]
MNKINILWADDEIEMLKPQILFLEQKGYQVTPVSNGRDAIERCREEEVDIVFLDESMPGMSGLETLAEIKTINAGLPVVMITKNEAEDIMEEAIGSQITDYLIKPVNPNQVLLTLKRIIDNKRLVSAKTSSDYQKEFQKIFSTIQDNLDFRQWSDLYKKLIYWELELSKSDAGGMKDVLTMQKQEANVEFNKFVTKNYLRWLDSDDKSTPVMSHTLMEKKIFPYMSKTVPTFLIVIDNLRLDQWKVIQPIIAESFRMVEDDTYYSILPTATQYCRNALFAGLLPLEIEEDFPKEWKNDEEEGGKNLHEELFMKSLFKRSFKDEIRSSYVKVTNNRDGKALEDEIHNYLSYDFVAIVYNFVDMLSHARTEMEVLKELAGDEAAYRSLALSWFEHSPLHNALKKLAGKNVNIIFTTDHGSIRVNTPSKCVADRATTTNIRYKNGKNLNFEPKDVFEIRNPHDAFLPKPHVSSTYIFAKEDKYFVYPNNYNHFVNFFRDTFQHGGISLEEIVIPFAVYSAK